MCPGNACVAEGAMVWPQRAGGNADDSGPAWPTPTIPARPNRLEASRVAHAPPAHSWFGPPAIEPPPPPPPAERARRGPDDIGLRRLQPARQIPSPDSWGSLVGNLRRLLARVAAQRTFVSWAGGERRQRSWWLVLRGGRSVLPAATGSRRGARCTRPLGSAAPGSRGRRRAERVRHSVPVLRWHAP